jgi:cytochrome c biogenesis protein CcdA
LLLMAMVVVVLLLMVAVFAAAVVWPNPVAAAVVMGLAFGVAWSRCVLGRHTVPEAVVGLLAGALGGVGLHGALG